MQIRILWDNEKEEKEAKKLADYLYSSLVRLYGHGIKVSHVYRNRRNNGGRIYISIPLKPRSSSKSRRKLPSYNG